LTSILSPYNLFQSLISCILEMPPKNLMVSLHMVYYIDWTIGMALFLLCFGGSWYWNNHFLLVFLESLQWKYQSSLISYPTISPLSYHWKKGNEVGTSISTNILVSIGFSSLKLFELLLQLSQIWNYPMSHTPLIVDLQPSLYSPSINMISLSLEVSRQ